MLQAWLAIAALAMIVAWGLGAARARRAGRALTTLREGLKALGSGDFAHRLDPVATAGLAGLAADFNRMAEGIQQRHHQMQVAREEADLLLKELLRSREHHRATLEEKVKERTGEVQKAYEELKRIDTLKDSFVSSVSHELRTPLSSIRSFSEILLSYEGDGETRREFLGIINQESERLTRLIDDMLDISKIEAGEMGWQVEPIPLAETCAQAIAPLTILARAKRLSLEVHVPEEIGSVMADRDRLIQVIENLVSNAIKFTGEGGAIRLTADASGRQDGTEAGMARIVVSDNGIGVPRQEMKRIFEKFKQVGDTLTGKPTGTGLGLPISREIVKHLGGRLWVEDVSGGSRFIFTLPLAGATARSEAGVVARLERPAPAARTWAAARAPFAGVRVAVVGADAARRDLLQADLRGLGLETVESPSAEEAARCCGVSAIGLILLDDPSPAHDGIAWLRLLRAAPRAASVPIVVISESMSREDALSAGATEHLGRPVDPVRLREKVATVLADRRPWVAVADDDAGTVGVLSELLSLRGFGVLTAFNGEEALRAARENDLELLILDLNMPRKSGWQVLEELRSSERTRRLPVIVLTGMEAEMDRARALALGAVEFLEKGRGLERLTAEIDLLVQRSV